VLAPPFVLDYLAAHEVAHLGHMNHGPRFWNLVERTMPRHEEAENLAAQARREPASLRLGRDAADPPTAARPSAASSS
jgi:predicted metal-dependent hydrolase